MSVYIFSRIEIYLGTCLTRYINNIPGVRCVLNMEFSFSGKGPGEMNFGATNVAETWRKWRQNMQFYTGCPKKKATL